MLATPFLLLSSASPCTSPWTISDAASVSPLGSLATEALAEPEAATWSFIDSALESQGPPVPASRPRQRFSFKGGYYSSTEDGIDDGFDLLVSYIRPLSPVLSSEVELGYLDASGTHNGVDRDVWSITFMANARLGVPVGEKLEVYGGLGLGTFYYNADADTLGVSVSADGFLFAGDAYFGGSIKLGESLHLGVEWKYYVTDSASDLDGGLDANVVMLTLGFDR